MPKFKKGRSHGRALVKSPKFIPIQRGGTRM